MVQGNTSCHRDIERFFGPTHGELEEYVHEITETRHVDPRHLVPDNERDPAVLGTEIPIINTFWHLFEHGNDIPFSPQSSEERWESLHGPPRNAPLRAKRCLGERFLSDCQGECPAGGTGCDADQADFFDTSSIRRPEERSDIMGAPHIVDNEYHG
jgi:hypothetical protein